MRTAVPVFALVFAFLAFGMSYVSGPAAGCGWIRSGIGSFSLSAPLCFQLCLRNSIRERSKTKQRFLEAPLKPLEAKDLMLIYTLGPKPKTRTVCV